MALRAAAGGRRGPGPLPRRRLPVTPDSPECFLCVARWVHCRSCLSSQEQSERAFLPCRARRALVSRRVTVDPYTGRATERYVNAAYCRLAGGAPLEAHLAAAAAHAVPEHLTQLDHLLRRAGPDRAGAIERHAGPASRRHAGPDEGPNEVVCAAAAVVAAAAAAAAARVAAAAARVAAAFPQSPSPMPRVPHGPAMGGGGEEEEVGSGNGKVDTVCFAYYYYYYSFL